MKAIHMPFDHERLMGLSRKLFLKHDWKMPEGLADPKNKDPRNYTLADYQQAKRSGQDARDIKGAIQDAWAISDTKAAFRHALEERGYTLARGDRRSFVAVDTEGEVYAISRMAGQRTKAVRDRLGEPNDLPSVAQAQKAMADGMMKSMDHMRAALKEKHDRLKAEYRSRKQALLADHAEKRQALTKHQETRLREEARIRQGRFRRGLSGLWDRLRGEHRRVQKANEAEAAHAKTRDRLEQDDLIASQLAQRRTLQGFTQGIRRGLQKERDDIEQDQARYQSLSDEAEAAFEARPPEPKRRRRSRREPHHGPSMGP